MDVTETNDKQRTTHIVNVLVFNAGSTSLKVSLHEVTNDSGTGNGIAPPAPQWAAQIQWSPPPRESTVEITTRTTDTPHTTTTCTPLESPLTNIDGVLATLWQGAAPVVHAPNAVDVIAHRIVFGGPTLRVPVRLTQAVRTTIAHAGEDAPEHTARELGGIDAATRVFGTTTPQVLVFDTTFHATLPPRAYAYPGPRAWLASGLRRYGFHGISHHYAAHRLASLLDRNLADLRIVTAHLGGGCSLAAVHGGTSVDTTMGFTPMDGLAMSTRSGAVDPGLLLHLLQHGIHDAESLRTVLNEESGLLGLSGRSGDVRELLGAAGVGDDCARLALDVYVHRIRQGIAAMAASMNGIDALVFTAGVGEHAAPIRADVCAGLQFLGVSLDAALNGTPSPSDRVISSASSHVAVATVHAEENWSIAQQTLPLMSQT